MVPVGGIFHFPSRQPYMKPLFAWLILACCLLMGCRRAESNRVQLEFWAIGSEGEIVQQLLDDFHRRHSDIRVVVQQIPWTAAHEKLLTAVAGQATPDLCQLGNTWIPEFAMLQAIRDLSAQVEQSETVRRQDYFDGIWATNEMDGTLYGVPWYVDTRVLFYRHDLLREAGWSSVPRTWSAWKRAMQAIQARMDEGGHAILLPTNEWEQIVILGLQMAEPLLREDGRFGNFRSDSFRRAFEFYIGLYRQDLAPVLASTEISNVWLELAQGRYAMYITGPWNMGEFRRRMRPDQLSRWSTAPMPTPDSSWPGRSLAGGCSLVVFRRSEHPAEAWKFIEYLSQPETQARFYQLSGNLPARQSAWDHSALRDDKWAVAFHEQLQHAAPTPQVPEWERIATRVYEVADQVIRRAVTVDAGLERLDEDVDRILEKRRWLLERHAAHWQTTKVSSNPERSMR
jgi:multiple sugar transport system substrate-binding protein